VGDREEGFFEFVGEVEIRRGVEEETEMGFLGVEDVVAEEEEVEGFD